MKEDGTDEGTVEDVDIEVEGIMYGEGVSFFSGSGRRIVEEGVMEVGA